MPDGQLFWPARGSLARPHRATLISAGERDPPLRTGGRHTRTHRRCRAL
eukprot:CAMPEP_0206620754 /NCGR_PEP_ID=MMETSP0325_2-20121206/61812_1 /ASSEMBLY_ACC=CAM_ASM_000347 /TAXON_ID=2866 /ORGANISM="Crypthecodinium cohnii, Strain Seligo" /LENGTH=48 /DNA_ID= /DNA_START= /DNA_END= /DNA_ORIENTATION=